MYNLHTHSLLSDGCLLPSELAVRYAAKGYKAIAITDHVDYSNIEPTVKAILNFTKRWPKNSPIKVLPGIELTHLPLQQFKPLAMYARKLGVKVIIGHGETTAEPVIKGTNRAALLADIDILAHPGLISDQDTKLAKQRGIFLEITTRHGHSRTNRHVIKQAKKWGAKLILSHDSHVPEDILTPIQHLKLAQKEGLTGQELDGMYNEVSSYLRKAI